MILKGLEMRLEQEHRNYKITYKGMDHDIFGAVIPYMARYTVN